MQKILLFIGIKSTQEDYYSYQSREYIYNNAGKLSKLSVFSPLGYSQYTYTYDSKGHPAKIQQNWAEPIYEGDIITLTCNDKGNITKAVKEVYGDRTTYYYEHDNQGNLAKITEYTPGYAETIYTYLIRPFPMIEIRTSGNSKYGRVDPGFFREPDSYFLTGLYSVGPLGFTCEEWAVLPIPLPTTSII